MRRCSPASRNGGAGVAKLLVVDDDRSVLSGLRRALSLAGYEVATAETGADAVAQAASGVDLVVLDVMLPDADGRTVCRQVRQFTNVPILMLTAKDTVPDRIQGLDSGADDYLVKPFAMDELLARARALLRRAGADASELAFEDLRVNLRTREALRGERPLKLTGREYDLLVFLLRNPRQALSREQLCQQVWGFGFEGESNFIDAGVKELRKKLEAAGEPRIVDTVRGYGYALRRPVA